MNAHKLTLEQCKARFVHRFTMEHVPRWARQGPYRPGTYYAPQYRTDSEWYLHIARFPGDPGLPKAAQYCEGGMPTWPLGQGLKRPYTAEDAAEFRKLGDKYVWCD